MTTGRIVVLGLIILLTMILSMVAALVLAAAYGGVVWSALVFCVALWFVVMVGVVSYRMLRVQ